MDDHLQICYGTCTSNASPQAYYGTEIHLEYMKTDENNCTSRSLCFEPHQPLSSSIHHQVCAINIPCPSISSRERIYGHGVYTWQCGLRCWWRSNNCVSLFDVAYQIGYDEQDMNGTDVVIPTLVTGRW